MSGFEQPSRLWEGGEKAGADAIKLQTYKRTQRSIAIVHFSDGKGTIWEGKNLYALYGEAYTKGLAAETQENARNSGWALFLNAV